LRNINRRFGEHIFQHLKPHVEDFWLEETETEDLYVNINKRFGFEQQRGERKTEELYLKLTQNSNLNINKGLGEH